VFPSNPANLFIGFFVFVVSIELSTVNGMQFLPDHFFLNPMNSINSTNPMNPISFEPLYHPWTLEPLVV
jgi:hypothetical protein